MPVYQYHCKDCGQFDQMVPMSMSREPCTCPECRKPAPRSIAAPYLAPSARTSIKAAGMNELAQHEPKHSSQLAHRHKPGCGCCGGGSSKISGKTMSNAAGDKMFPTKRPWMISH